MVKQAMTLMTAMTTGVHWDQASAMGWERIGNGFLEQAKH